MQSFEYFILHENGARVNSRPDDIVTAYDAYSVLSADSGMILRHKKTGKRSYNVTILSDYARLWEEIEDKQE